MTTQTPFWYNAALACIKPFYRWRVKKRSGHLSDYGDEVIERFGTFQPVKNRHCIWFHAVSVGETNAAQPLIAHYLQQGQAVLLTNTTRTGQARAKALFAKQYPQLFQAVFLPIDQYALIHQFITLNQPRIVLLMETELWPNLLQCLAEKQIPALLLNARLSAKSAKGYGKVPRLSRPMVEQLSWIAGQDEATAQRYQQLGANPQKISILGNIKFDIQAPQTFLQQAQQLVTQWQLAQRRIILLASTHAPEEQQLLAALAPTLQQQRDLLCIVVPRHPERFEEVFQLIQALSLQVGRRSLQQNVQTDTQVYLADSMGELWLWYALAQVAYVGGSLNTPGGGHNILEPIALNVATVLGKNYFNFQTIVDEFAQAEAVKIADNAQQAVNIMLQLLQHPQQRQHMTARAAEILNKNQGAVARHIALIDGFLQS